MALCYLDTNPRFQNTTQHWKGKRDFRSNKAKVCALISKKFILYSDAPPVVFVSVVDNDHNVYVPDTPSQE